MEKVYILGACRTPIGKMGKSLAGFSASDLGAAVISEALQRSGIDYNQVDHVFMGCVIQAGLGQNVSRQAAIKAGIDISTPAETINAVCGSSLSCINIAANMIRCGDADIVIAGGMESMTNAPFALSKARFGYRMGYPANNSSFLMDTMVKDALWDAFNDVHMGVTAENIAKKWNLSRREIDSFAIQSQEKAIAAIDNGLFDAEIIALQAKQKNEVMLINKDEAPRRGLTLDALGQLEPAFQPDGVITAGNSSGINDGAAAVVMVSEKKIMELKLTPQAEWIGGAMEGVDPAIMGIGPVASTKKLLKKMDMTIDDIDLVEGNEAFAAQSLAVQRELQIPDDKLNIHGGAIALGHPVGASGCRILVTLIHALKARNDRFGLATLCIGGGMGCSTLIKNFEV